MLIGAVSGNSGWRAEPRPASLDGCVSGSEGRYDSTRGATSSRSERMSPASARYWKVVLLADGPLFPPRTCDCGTILSPSIIAIFARSGSNGALFCGSVKVVVVSVVGVGRHR